MMKKLLGDLTLREIVAAIDVDGCKTCLVVSYCENLSGLCCDKVDGNPVEAFFDTEHVEVPDIEIQKLVRINGIIDHKNFEDICKSLTENGWVGPPVVVYRSGSELAITGSHRISAVEKLRRYHKDFILFKIPTIGLDEIFIEAGLDIKEHENKSLNYYKDALHLVSLLPKEIYDKYTIDLL